MQAKVKEMNELAAKKDQLELDQQFLDDVKEQIVRFKKEIDFRKDQEEQARIEAELKAAKRAKKKK